MAYKTFVNGFPLNASELNTFLMNQSVATFADAAARIAAIATPAEGQLTYLNSDDSYYKYDGAAWVKLTGMSNDLVPTSPNYIINGAFDFWQRGTSFTPPSTAAQFNADRWYVERLTGATISRQSFTPAETTALGFGESPFYMRIASAGATTNQILYQKVEDVRTLAGQTVTVSFYAKSATEQEYRVRLTQNFGSGGSADVNTSQTAPIIGTSWARYTSTFTLPSISGKTVGTGSSLILDIRDASDSSFTLDIWGVQLEAGSVATPFRRNANSIQGELAACQRYYYKMESVGGLHIEVGFAGSTTAARYALKTPVQMRTTPTLTATNLRIGFGAFSTNTPSAIAIQGYLGNSAEIRATASTTSLTAGQAVLLNTDASLGGSLELSAEL